MQHLYFNSCSMFEKNISMIVFKHWEEKKILLA